MAFNLTDSALNASLSLNKTTNIVVEIEGIDTLFGSTEILKIAQYGDPILYGDPGLVYGGSIADPSQNNLISLQSGTTTTIRQTLQIDKGKGESISSMVVALIDRGGYMTNLITPGNVVEEVLGRRCKIRLGLNNTNYPDDYLTIFRGVIDNISSASGMVFLSIAHPDNKKKTDLFAKVNTELTGAMTSGATIANVTDTSEFRSEYVGPNGLVDDSIQLFLRIDNELMRYEVKGPGQFSSLTRGLQGTLAASHSAGANVESYYLLQGNAIDLALKLMLSGINGGAFDEVPVTNFVRISSVETISNAIWFEAVDVIDAYNIMRGDYVSSTGATNPINNFSNLVIDDVVTTSSGSYIIIDGASLVEELLSDALLSFTSQYDTLGIGLKMLPDEVDINEHLSVKDKYLNSFDYRFVIPDEINGKEFLSEQIYNPSGAFSLPRKAQSSVGYHAPPLPIDTVQTLDTSNVLNAPNLKIERSINKNFFNSIIYKYEEDVLEPDRFTKGRVQVSGSSQTRIPLGDRSNVLDAKGMRDDLSATQLIDNVAQRRLKKYQFGAEYIKSLKVDFKTGWSVEIGDIALVDLNKLQISDITTGNRSGESRLFQIENKVFDLKTGQVDLDLVDTNFDKDARYGLISPASLVKTGNSGTSFVIKPSFTQPFGQNEFRKWEGFVGESVRVRSADFSVTGDAIIDSIAGNTITLSTDLGFTPLEDYIMEFSRYDSIQLSNVKTLYVFRSDDVNDFADDKPYYGFS